MHLLNRKTLQMQGFSKMNYSITKEHIASQIRSGLYLQSNALKQCQIDDSEIPYTIGNIHYLEL